MINDNPEIGGAEFYMRRGNNPNKTIGSLNSGPTSNCDVRNGRARASTCCVSGPAVHRAIKAFQNRAICRMRPVISLITQGKVPTARAAQLNASSHDCLSRIRRAQSTVPTHFSPRRATLSGQPLLRESRLRCDCVESRSKSDVRAKPCRVCVLQSGKAAQESTRAGLEVSIAACLALLNLVNARESSF
jgi:hypothetical protein